MWHPFLFAAFPVVFLWAENLGEGVGPRDVVVPLAVILAGAAVLMLIATPLYGSAAKAGLAVSAIVLLFFSYGHVAEVVTGWHLGGILVGRTRNLLLLWLVLLAASLVLAWRAGRRVPSLTGGLNVVAAVLLIVNGVRIGAGAFGGSDAEPVLDVQELTAGAQVPAQPRDIIYIIPDRYAGQRTLEEHYGFDNSPFLDELRARGFYVPQDPWANYPRSSPSIASSLNATHLDVIESSDDGGRRALRGLYDGPRVARALQSLGYRYVHIGTWWSTTARDPHADVNIEFGGASEFTSILFETTVLRPVAERLGFLSEQLNFRRREFQRIPFQFEQIARAHQEGDDQPSFVFAHLLLPHEPFIFDRDGNYLRFGQVQERGQVRNYTEQLMYANAKILELLDELLAGPEEEHPIIVLQSDEGPEPLEADRYIHNWGEVGDSELRQKLRILNAYYFPGVADPPLYEEITPVNSFRVLFNAYFGTDLDLLPDRTYLGRGPNMTDITPRLRDDEPSP